MYFTNRRWFCKEKKRPEKTSSDRIKALVSQLPAGLIQQEQSETNHLAQVQVDLSAKKSQLELMARKDELIWQQLEVEQGRDPQNPHSIHRTDESAAILVAIRP